MTLPFDGAISVLQTLAPEPLGAATFGKRGFIRPRMGRDAYPSAVKGLQPRAMRSRADGEESGLARAPDRSLGGGPENRSGSHDA